MTTTIKSNRIIVGRSGATKIFQWGSGYVDDATKYELLAKTDPLAPAGAGGECAFHAVYVYVSHEVAVPIVTTVFVDGAQVATKTVTLALPSARKRRIIKVPIIKRFPSSVTGYATASSFAGRGTWVQVQVETLWGANTPGYLCIEGIELEKNDLRVASLVSGSNK
jgi:hypothetical protein